MEKTTAKRDEGRMISESRAALDEIVRQGAQRILQEALEHEVAEYLAMMAGKKDGDGRQEIVRNGYLPERELITGVGPLSIQKLRVRDRAKKDRFSSWILPPFMRRVPSIDALIPVLDLKGISTGDFSEALEAILGPQAAGLSATNIVRLKEGWKEEYEAWAGRDLSDKRYVYWWADGIYFNVRLDTERPCLLIIIGALEDRTKELVAVWDGIRESKASWLEVLRDLKARGLAESPQLAVGDGALGFWVALEEEQSETREQRCWVHKTANVLDKLLRSVQPYAKKMIHEMYLSPTKEKALIAYRRFLAEYEAKYPKAMDCLRKDEDVLFTFYDFPAEHWMHIRTTNPIESAFATVRHRTRQTKGCGSRLATLMMVFKLAKQAERHWRKLNSAQLLAHVIRGVVFTDGVMENAA
jgi:transposase-like protein